MRIFDSVLLPIFDHVRAEVTDTTTFTDEKRRAEVDAWLYETCTKCLQHMVDLVVQFYGLVQPLLSRILDLLSNFIRCPTQLAGSKRRCICFCPLLRPSVSTCNESCQRRTETGRWQLGARVLLLQAAPPEPGVRGCGGAGTAGALCGRPDERGGLGGAADHASRLLLRHAARHRRPGHAQRPAHAGCRLRVRSRHPGCGLEHAEPEAQPARTACGRATGAALHARPGCIRI